jgi:hypothetical protein
MSDNHSIAAYDAQGNRYRLTVYRELIGASTRGADPAASFTFPIDIIGPRGEWVSLLYPGRYLLKPLEKDRSAIELYSDEPIAP